MCLPKDFNETECLTLLRDTFIFLLVLLCASIHSYTNMFGRIAVFISVHTFIVRDVRMRFYVFLS